MSNVTLTTTFSRGFNQICLRQLGFQPDAGLIRVFHQSKVAELSASSHEVSNIKTFMMVTRSSARKSRSSPGLLRPKNQVSYNLPKDIQALLDASHSESREIISVSQRKKGAAASPSNASESIIACARIQVLLNLIHQRNKNQHRNQPFFKHINFLRRAIKHLTKLHHQHMHLEKSTNVPQKKPTHSSKLTQTTTSTNAESVRRKFENQAELRSQREVHEEWIRETLVPNAYIAFSSLVASDNFSNLAVTSIGVLSDVTKVVGAPRRFDKPQTKFVSKAAVAAGNATEKAILHGTSTIATGRDLGEVTERVYDSAGVTDQMEIDGKDDLGTLIERVASQKQHGMKKSSLANRISQDESRPLHDTSQPNNLQDGPSSDQMVLTQQSHQPGDSTAMSDPPSVKPPLITTRKTPSQSINSGQSQIEKGTTRRDQPTTLPRKKNKKKKSKNAIDELFSGFS